MVEDGREVGIRFEHCRRYGSEWVPVLMRAGQLKSGRSRDGHTVGHEA